MKRYVLLENGSPIYANANLIPVLEMRKTLQRKRPASNFDVTEKGIDSTK